MFELVAYNSWLIFFNVIMVLAMYLLLKPAFRNSRGIKRYKLILSIILLYLFVEFSFWGSDWFALYETYEEIMLEHSPVEEVYMWIANHLAPYDYLRFRLIVWGSALTMLLYTLKRLPINFNLTLAIFASSWIIWFSYGRVSLAMAFAFLGVSLLYKPLSLNMKERNTKHIYKFLSFAVSAIIGCTLIYYAYYFHRSSIFIIAIIPMAVLFGLFSKRAMFVTIAFILLVLVSYQEEIKALLQYATVMANDFNSSMERGQMYMERQERFQGTGYMLGQILEKIPYYMLAISSLQLWNAKYPAEIKVFMRILIIIVSSATALPVMSALNMQILYDRFLKFSIIPATIVLSYFLSNQVFPKWHKAVFYLALLSTAYQLLYIWYCSLYQFA